MRKTGSTFFKLLIVAVLLSAAGLAIIRYGIGPASILLSASALAVLFMCFIRGERPEGEMPCRAVSCCHFLEDRERKSGQDK